MQSKFIILIFTLMLFIVTLLVGFYIGTVSNAGSHSSQLYAGAQEMRAALMNLNKNDIPGARAILCRSIETRLQILDLAKPALTERKVEEVNAIKQAWLYKNINESKDDFMEICP